MFKKCNFQVNEVNIADKSQQDIVKILRAAVGTVTLRLARLKSELTEDELAALNNKVRNYELWLPLISIRSQNTVIVVFNKLLSTLHFIYNTAYVFYRKHKVEIIK